MAAPSSSPQDVLQKESPKSSFQTPSPVTNQASELVAADAPPPAAIPIPNGTAEMQPTTGHNIYDTQKTELSSSLEPHLSADSAAGSTAGTGQSPASPSLATTSSTTEAAASFAHPPAPSVNTPREPLHQNQMDKNGDKPVDPSVILPVPQKSSPPPRRESVTRIPPTGVQTNGGSKPKDSSASRSPKPSFLSKLLRVLVPCVSPSPGTHPIELNDSSSLSTSKEKDISNSVDHVVETKSPSTPPITVTTATTPPIPPAVEPATVSTLDSTPTVPSTLPSAEGDVILPPTPPTAPQLLPYSETEGLTSGAVQPPGSTGGSVLHEKGHSRDSTVPSNASEGEESEGTSFTEDEDMDGLDDEDDEDKLIMNGGVGIPIGPDGVPKPLLPPISPHHVGRKCLILDLDETLVHSSFKSIQQADYVVPVEIEYHWHNVYVIKRPGVDNFLKKMGEIYEIVVFTASLSKYADPVLDKLDIHQVVSHRLFRESCYNHKGNYVKDLSQLGRPIADTIILDNSPASYIFHPNNAVPVSSWFNDPHDTELTDLIPFLADLATVDDVRGVLDGAR